MKKLLFALFLIFLVSIHAHAMTGIESDMAAGVPLPQVIHNALTANMTIEEIVAQCIAAGADCIPVVNGAVAVKATSVYSIVYAAIKAKPDRATDILRTALGIPGINAGSIITAAVTAYPSAVADIRTVALTSNVPEATVFAAISAVAPSAQPGFSASQASTASPGGAGGIGGTGGTGGGGYGGGGGGGTPASPSK